MIPRRDRPHHHLGEEVFSWETHNYHPHERGKMWHLGFVLFIITCMWGIMLLDEVQGWISALCFALVGIVYLIVHSGEHDEHEVRIHEHGMVIDERHHFDWNHFDGYFFVEDPMSRQIIFEIDRPHKQDKVILMMGDLHRQTFKDALDHTDLKELKDGKEGIMRMWFRVFKL